VLFILKTKKQARKIKKRNKYGRYIDRTRRLLKKILYSNSLWAGQSSDRNPMATNFSAPVQIGSGTHPASYTMGTGSLSRR
jgi:hypothetical protein